MEFISEDLLQYCQDHTTEEDDLLQRISRDTHAKVLMPRMLSGHLQGKTLELFTKMQRPKTILEIGTYTGYSAICMARGLDKDGKIITIDKNDELEEMVREYFAASGLDDQIQYILGNAMELIPGLNETFDMVFIDADKRNYSNYYHMIIDKVNPGGLILADNVLWSGKVVDDHQGKADKSTQAILDFNKMVQEDDRVENVLFPIRDGIMMARKR
ncbi:O-methyltransferase [Echinicola vietnamensis]|uniref:Putative O-methyltransferase n=1 Tax=Echinicola vietnamensis (strain DSM 17526 / LMG 23754 / KMM 6221) TaxID=926556 RepID=L0FQY0_ECHVK|nr:O-methyltransferase [Echinicola vietnamensis]AGA76359.1 putative O-methyltransferase [Echinicola vietnamensis DSM 17526]